MPGAAADPRANTPAMASSATVPPAQPAQYHLHGWSTTDYSMLSVLLACLAMTARDALGTGLTVSEAHNRAVLAGFFDAAGDLAMIAVTVLGAGVVLEHGLNGHAIVVLSAMTITSFFGTLGYTKLANRMMPPEAQTVDADKP